MAPPIFCYLPLTSNPEIPEKKPWVRLTWKTVLCGRDDEARPLAPVPPHRMTFGKSLPLSEPQ